MPLYVILVPDVRITRETIQRVFRAIPSSMTMERLVQWVIGTWPNNHFEVQLAAAIVSGYFVKESLRKSWIYTVVTQGNFSQYFIVVIVGAGGFSKFSNRTQPPFLKRFSPRIGKNINNSTM